MKYYLWIAFDICHMLIISN